MSGRAATPGGTRAATPGETRVATSGPAPEAEPLDRLDRALLDRIHGVVAAPGPLLVVTDFDGTIARIRPDPPGSVIEPLARRALRRLARLAAAEPDRLAVVVLSGRAVVDVASRVRVGGIEYHGNHGLEHGRIPRGGRAERIAVTHDPALLPWHPVSHRLGSRVDDHVGEDWLFVERKGPSVAFHYRDAPDGRAARERVISAVEVAMAEVRPEDGPGAMERFEGRKLVELRPVGAGGKGATFARLLDRSRPGSVVVLGDDRSDAEAFAVARTAVASGALAASLAVGAHGDAETPPEMVAEADVVVAGPHVAARVLAALARALEREAAIRR